METTPWPRIHLFPSRGGRCQTNHHFLLEGKACLSVLGCVLATTWAFATRSSRSCPSNDSGCSTPPIAEEEHEDGEDIFNEFEVQFARRRSTAGRTSQGRPLQVECRYLSTYGTVYVPAEEIGEEPERGFLCAAVAMGSTRAIGNRNGRPLLSYECVAFSLLLLSLSPTD